MDDPNPLLSLGITAATAAAALCFLSILWTLRSGPRGLPKKSPRTAATSSSGGAAAGGGAGGARGSALPNGDAAGDGKAAAPERQTGASMMEQLVPEITTHALSYLDYQSLCRLSMTNCTMRRAANDDGAWKALYHKDFTMEQDTITPINGWKAYYSATRAVVNVNAEFYNIIRERSLPAMSRFWLHADYVKCIRGNGELNMGYTEVINSWAVAFNWGQGDQGEQGAAFQIRDVRARVMTDMAWVTMKAYVNLEGGPYHVTNIYEVHNGRWYMVHHHSSPGLIMDGAPEMMVV